MPSTIDARPTNRSWPSLISVSLRNVSRHTRGATNGSMPSTISSSANAGHNESTLIPRRSCVASPQSAARRYFAGTRGVRPDPYCLKYWKNSALGSRTMRSLLFRNVDR